MCYRKCCHLLRASFGGGMRCLLASGLAAGVWLAGVVRAGDTNGMVWIAGQGAAVEGAGAGESGFWMDRHEVTNEEFAGFVKATGYRTIAERSSVGLGVGGLSEFMRGGSLVFEPVMDQSGAVLSLWKWRRGATWRFPSGPGSSIENRMDHPVVQVSVEDAKAYARWCGKRLPEVGEWAWAWRSQRRLVREVAANLWQGEFPGGNLMTDGFRETSPVGHFSEAAVGVADLCGNVAEWCLRPEGEGLKALGCGGSYLSRDGLGREDVPSVELDEGTSRPDLGFRCVLDALSPEGRGR
jgi:hypothetical protein